MSSEDEEAANRQTASLGGVAITLLLLVVGLFLVRELHAKGEGRGLPDVRTHQLRLARDQLLLRRHALTRGVSVQRAPIAAGPRGQCASPRWTGGWWRTGSAMTTAARCPLGSTEQHAGLSLATDAILAERVAAEAAEPLGIPVFPALPYGLTPYFTAFPGTVTLRVATYAAVLRDVLDSLKQAGFRRVLIVNGHGGNQPAGGDRAGMDDGQSRRACALPRLVARAAHRRGGAGDRSGGEPRELDGELPLDPPG